MRQRCVVLAAAVVALVALAWLTRDGRVLVGSMVLPCAAAVTCAVLARRAVNGRSADVFLVLVCVSAAIVLVASMAYLTGNWDYMSGRAAMVDGRATAAIESYRRALKQMERPGFEFVGEPSGLTLTTAGLVSDRHVEVYSDLGYLSATLDDPETAREWYLLALRSAIDGGHSSAVIRDIQTALERLGTE